VNQELFMPQNKHIVSKTDLSGRITYGNSLFIEMSGYLEQELLGAPHNILRHPDMPSAVFKLLWDRVRAKKEVFAYVKNKTKNGDFYWVFANVTPSMDRHGSIVGFHSVRRKPSVSAIGSVSGLYHSMLNAERTGGVLASERILSDHLNKIGKTYDEFIFSL
jgi:PAS domain S-box-containing protein